jgi:dihydroorotate dehydrogenase electron transfer subunit
MSISEPESESGPLQVRGTVLTVRRVDAYHAMTVVAPGIAARFKPGQFVTVAVGGPDTSMVLRRAFSIHDVRPDHGGTVEFIFAVTGRGTMWLAERRARDVLDVTGPLGRPFPVPRDPRLRQRSAVRACRQAQAAPLHRGLPAGRSQR